MPRRRTKKYPPPKRGGCIGRFLGLSFLVLSGWLAWTWFTLPQPRALEHQAPAHSVLMTVRMNEAKAAGRTYPLHHQYVGLNQISPLLQRAVVLSEDQKFWTHEGIDWVETRKAVDESLNEGRLGRGASTITQQLVKNLYLSNERSLLRKAKEWILATRIERSLSKNRILELYLNFAEWGDGVFGAEMAAQRYFNKSAAQLDAAEAAILTAMLPSPLTRDPRKSSTALKRRARMIGAMLVNERLAESGAMKRRLDQLP